MEYDIPDRRDLKQEEYDLLFWLISIEKPDWLKVLPNLKVIARCGCGKCPTIMFGEALESNIQIGELFIDYTGQGSKGELIGVSVLGTEHMPTELELWSIDGEYDIIELPNLDTLKPMNNF
jgi:hypothetical protein